MDNKNENELLNKYKKEILKLKNELKEINIKDYEKEKQNLIKEIEFLKEKEIENNNEKEVLIKDKKDIIMKYEVDTQLYKELNNYKFHNGAENYIKADLKSNIRLDENNKIEILDKDGNVLKNNNKNMDLKTYIENVKINSPYFFKTENESVPHSTLDIENENEKNNSLDEYYFESFMNQ